MDASETPSAPGPPSPSTAVATAPPQAVIVAPVAGRERIAHLDVLRGFALWGIFFVNAPIFALPMAVAFGMPDASIADRGDVFAAAFVRTFFEYKFVTLFSMLFGAGFAIQMARGGKAGAATGRGWRYVRRLAVLFVFGLVHALVLWYGDILFLYACGGLVLLAFHKARPPVLLGCAIGCFALSVLLATAAMSMRPTSALPAAALPAIVDAYDGPRGPAYFQDAGRRAGEGDDSGFQFDDDGWIAAETLAYRDGPFLDAFTFRGSTWFFSLRFYVVPIFSWRVLGAFLLGAYLIRSGFFATGDAGARARRRRLAVVGLIVGLAAEFASTGIELSWTATATKVAGAFLHEAGSIALSLGYLGLVCVLVDRRAAIADRLGPIADAFARLGRIALTGYLLETILATALFLHWGAARFGSMDRLDLLGVSVAIPLAVTLFAVIWTRVFDIGPFEWLWRSLTYLRPMHWRRPGAGDPAVLRGPATAIATSGEAGSGPAAGDDGGTVDAR